MKRSALPLFTAALAGVFALSACGTTDTSKPAGDTAAAGDCATDSPEAATGPVTVTDDTGTEVTLDKPAESVVSLEWQSTEDLLSLCVTPAAVADVKGYSTWDTAEALPESVTDVGTRQEPNIETIVSADPDLVIAEVTSRDEKIVTQLEDKGIPVIALGGAETKDPIGYMKDTFTLIAEATGRTERAEQVIGEFDDTLAKGKAAIAAADLETTDFVYFDGYLNGANVALRPFGQGSLFGEIGEELGLHNVWDGEVDPAYGLGQSDIEGLSKVGDGHFFLTGTEDPTAENFVDALEKNDIWTNIPAVKNDRVHPFPAGIWTFGGPRSSAQAVTAYVDALTEQAA